MDYHDYTTEHQKGKHLTHEDYELGRIYHQNHAPIYQLLGMQKIK